MVLALAGSALLALALLALSADSPRTAANRFLTALARGEAEELTNLSYFEPPRDAATVRGLWAKTLDRGAYFRFVWRIRGTTELPNDRATVAIQYVRDAGTRFAYEENFSLDMVRDQGRWKVDVLSLSREMYPALPR
jgi:hypothetical protein